MRAWYLLLILLCVPLALAYDTTTTWSQGNTTLNISFDGTNNYTGNLSIPSGAWGINISFNITGYESTSGSQALLTQNGSAVANRTTFRGSYSGWQLFPELFADNDSTTSSVVTHTTAFYGDILPNTTYSDDAFIRTQFNLTILAEKRVGASQHSIQASCWNHTTETWVNMGTVILTTPEATHVFDNIIESGCWDNNNNVSLRLISNCADSGQSDNLSNIQLEEYEIFDYPTNVTLVFNDELKYTHEGNLSNTTPVVVQINKSYTDDLFDIVFKSNASGFLYVSDLFSEWNSPNLSIRIHTEQRDLLYQASNVTLKRIYDNVSWDSYWTTDGLINVILSNISGILDLHYYDPLGLFPQRHFYYYNDPTKSVNITLYVVNETNVSQVLFTLYRENGAVLQDYYVGVDKYLPDLNKYVTVEMHNTDFNGQALLNVEYLGAQYRFNVYDSNLSLLYSSGKTEIKSTSISLTIRLTEDIWGSLNNIDEITVGVPNYTNTTSQFIAYYKDNTGVVEYIDFITKKRTLFGDVTICNNRSTASEAYLYCTVNLSDGGVFISDLFVKTNTNYSYYWLSGGEFQSSDVPSKTGDMGVFATILLVFGMVAIGIFSPVVALVLGVVALVVAFYLKILFLQVSTIIVMAIIAGILIFKMRA